MSDKAVQKVESLTDRAERVFEGIEPTYSPRTVLLKAEEEIEKFRKDKKYELSNTALVQAMSLREFETSVAMASGLPEHVRTLAMQMSKELQTEYKCDTSGKKSLAEVSALNYCRVLVVQKRLNNFMEKESYGDLTIKIIATLSKELDRAERHYITSLQALEVGLQPPMSMTVRTQVANVANQQMVQNQIAKDRAEYGI